MKSITTPFITVVFFFFYFGTCLTQPLVPYLKDGLYGFANSKGEIIVEPQFNDVSCFGNHEWLSKERSGAFSPLQNNHVSKFAKVKIGKSVTFIDEAGNYILPLQETDLSMAGILNGHHNKSKIPDNTDSLNQHYLRICRFSGWGFYNISNREFSGFKYNNENLFEVRRVGYDCVHNHYIDKKDYENLNLITVTGEMIKEAQEDIFLLEDFYGCVKNDSLFVSNYDKDFEIHYKIKSVRMAFDNKYLLVNLETAKGETNGIINHNGDLILDMVHTNIYKIADTFYANKASIQDEEESVFIYDLDGNQLKNDSIISISHQNNYNKPNKGTYIIHSENSSSIVDYNGHLISKVDGQLYKSFKDYYKKKEGSTCLLDFNFQSKVCSRFDNIKNLEGTSKYFLISQNDKKGIINQSGELIIKPEHRSISYLEHDKFLLSDENFNRKIIDKEGKVLCSQLEKMQILNCNNSTLLYERIVDTLVFYDLNNRFIEKISIQSKWWNSSQRKVIETSQKKALQSGHGLIKSDSIYESFILKGQHYFAINKTENTIGFYANNKLLHNRHFDFSENINTTFSWHHIVINDKEGIGLSDDKSNWIIKPGIMEEITISGQLIFVKKINENKYSIYDEDLSLITLKPYDIVEDLSSKYIKVGTKSNANSTCQFLTQNGLKTSDLKYGLLSSDGTRLIPDQYASIEYIQGGIFYCNYCDNQTTKTDVYDFRGVKLYESPKELIFPGNFAAHSLRFYTYGNLEHDITPEDSSALFKIVGVSRHSVDSSWLTIKDFMGETSYNSLRRPEKSADGIKFNFCKSPYDEIQNLAFIEKDNLIMLNLNRFIYMDKDQNYILDETGKILDAIPSEYIFDEINMMKQYSNKLNKNLIYLNYQNQLVLYDFQNSILFADH